MILALAVSIAIVWQSINSVREINQQKISSALNQAIAGIQEQILVVELMAGSMQRIVQASDDEHTQLCSLACMRMALESTVVAFQQRHELSHLGLVLPASGLFGNLERLDDGGIVLWLPAQKDNEEGETMQSLLWTDKGFMPYLSATPGRDDAREESRRRLSVQQTAWQGDTDGEWQLHDSSWMMHQTTQEWSIGYRKALHDDNGRLIGVFDANFALSAIQPYIASLQETYGIELNILVQDQPPHMIRSNSTVPLSVPEYFIPLMEMPAGNVTDVLYIEGQRYWVGAQKLVLQGRVDWLVIASNHVPWLDVMLGDRMIYVLVIALVLLVGSSGGMVYMIYRLGRAENKKINADFDHITNHDDLTGLPNRTALDHCLKQAVVTARENDTKFALLYLTLDRFKSINDSYGYQFGNAVLRALGEKLTRLVRSQDMVAYLSGDHFLILLDQLHHKDEARRLIRLIMEGIKQPLNVQDSELHLITSIGVSLFPSHGDNVNVLLNNAEIAMYEVKKSGGDSYQFFSPEMGQRLQENRELESRLTNALSENQLHLVYQPKVSLHDGKIIGCEALMRWIHPELGNISPARFIPLAEKSGLIVSMGDWALRTACQQAKLWLDSGLSPICVAVNLSMRQFLRRDVVKWVADILQNTGLPAHCLELELTESLLPQDMERAIVILDQLHALGIKLSLDDFGTGYSNLSYLKRLHIDTLKIDQAFVRGALGSRQDAAIVSAVVDLAHNLGCKALAEGVETRGQLDFVHAQGCDEIQGYYFSRPVAAETYAIMLRDGIMLDGIISLTGRE